MSKRTSAKLLILSIFLLAASGCVPYYVNTQDLGERAETAAEVRAYVSGYFFPNDQGGDYYHPDGRYNAISSDRRSIAIGTWNIHDGVVGPSLCESYTFYVAGTNNRQPASPVQRCYIVYFLPDGTANLDQMGGGNFRLLNRTKGFSLQSVFNALRHQMGV